MSEVLKEQAQKYVNAVMKDSHGLGKDFDKWVKDVGNVGFVVRSKREGAVDEVTCYDAVELKDMLDLGADEHIVEGVLGEGEGCFDCQWGDECND